MVLELSLFLSALLEDSSLTFAEPSWACLVATTVAASDASIDQEAAIAATKRHDAPAKKVGFIILLQSAGGVQRP